MPGWRAERTITVVVGVWPITIYPKWMNCPIAGSWEGGFSGGKEYSAIDAERAVSEGDSQQGPKEQVEREVHAEIDTAVSDQQGPCTDRHGIPAFAEKQAGEGYDGKADGGMGRYGAIETAPIVVDNVDPGLNIRIMGGPEFGKVVFEKIADLIGGNDGHSDAKQHPEESFPAVSAPNAPQNSGIQRNPNDFTGDPIEKSIPTTSPAAVEREQKLLIGVKDILPHRQMVMCPLGKIRVRFWKTTSQR